MPTITSKKKVDDKMPAPVSYPQMYEITKAQAKAVALGDHVTITVEGEITSVRKNDNGSEGDVYSIDLRNCQVKDLETNRADASFRKMVGEARSVPAGGNGGTPRVKNEADRSADDLRRSATRSY